MTESDAVEALTRLGLSTYEAKVFVALQKLGAATASEVDEVTDVPRSQVYGAADDLEARGLAEVQQGKPKRYRPVDLDEARRRLRQRLEREEERAFDYLDAVEGEASDDTERQEEIWTLRGRDHITDRIGSLVRDAGEYVFYALGEEFLDEDVEDDLLDAVGRGVPVVVASSEEPVLTWARDLDGVVVERVPEQEARPVDGRLLMVDHETVLMSVVGEAVDRETAILSSETGFAQVFVSLIETGLERTE